jgi:TetR/AcrR family transcriptional regulator, transcriptional repressor for nem operon
MPRNKAYSDDLVLEKAMNLFWVHGYEGTSVRMLEKNMGINQFSIYASFKNKKNLFINALRKYREYAIINRYYDFIRNMILKVLQNAVKKGEIPTNTDIEKQASFFLGVMQGISVAGKTMGKGQLKDFVGVALNQIK